ncbi:C2H2 zinc finger protein [Rutstroemia sp. NJR-2017a BBW]|nr:C2H2 zinc finger protein [Rutstroemia sp. NJR-2017a BBW]
MSACPTSSRTASISSTSSSTKLSTIGKKKFCCSFPSCGKSFSRSEHLHRHALNHKDGNHTCLRCRAHFRRRDLLDRHMNRHKEKDDEAGGEGLGVLATRKRLWRDADGNIVNTRRPSFVQEGTKRRQTARGERKTKANNELTVQLGVNPLPSPSMTTPSIRSRSPSTIIVDSGNCYSEADDHKRFEAHQTVVWNGMSNSSMPSPPISEPSIQSTSHSPAPELSDIDGLYEEAWPNHLPHIPAVVNSRPAEYDMGHSHWGSQPFQTFMGAMPEVQYEDIFKPETGMYDWQHWNNQMLMSRCREEKYGAQQEEVKREWTYTYPSQAGGNFHRAYGVGRC